LGVFTPARGPLRRAAVTGSTTGSVAAPRRLRTRASRTRSLSAQSCVGDAGEGVEVALVGVRETVEVLLGGLCPRRRASTAPSLSHASCLGTAHIARRSCQWPAIRSGAVQEGIITAHRIREYPEVITGTGGEPFWPAPSGIIAGGNHRSHCTR
jgi:hypothetical protein